MSETQLILYDITTSFCFTALTTVGSFFFGWVLSGLPLLLFLLLRSRSNTRAEAARLLFVNLTFVRDAPSFSISFVPRVEGCMSRINWPGFVLSAIVRHSVTHFLCNLGSRTRTVIPYSVASIFRLLLLRLRVSMIFWLISDTRVHSVKNWIDRKISNCGWTVGPARQRWCSYWRNNF